MSTFSKWACAFVVPVIAVASISAMVAIAMAQPVDPSTCSKSAPTIAHLAKRYETVGIDWSRNIPIGLTGSDVSNCPMVDGHYDCRKPLQSIGQTSDVGHSPGYYSADVAAAIERDLVNTPGTWLPCSGPECDHITLPDGPGSGMHSGPFSAFRSSDGSTVVTIECPVYITDHAGRVIASVACPK